MSKRELEHAVRYATESTKVFLMEFYKQKFPHIFQSASMETRLANKDDYYVPPSIADKCIVVVKTRFDETGCRRLGCFPYKKYLKPCEKTDEPHWIQIGKDFYVACSPICQTQTSLDTDWQDDKCISVNNVKKMVALIPEHLFEREARHRFHRGLDFVNGQLNMNKTYCEAYGLDFDGSKCYSSTEQSIGEWFIGSTGYRAIHTRHLKPWTENTPVKLPDYLDFDLTTQQTREKRSVIPEPPSSEIAKQMAIDLAGDLGMDITEVSVKHLLTKKAPKLLSQAIGNIAVKTALKEAVKNSLIRVSTGVLKGVGSVLGIAGDVYALYSFVIDTMDTIDPFDFLKVLDKESLDNLNKHLDYTYFGEEGIRPEVTPEYIWDRNLLKIEDESKRYAYMAEKIQEYLDALHTISNFDTKVLKQFDSKKLYEKKNSDWNWMLHKSIIFVLMAMMIIYIDWIHVWTVILFFIMLYYNDIFEIIKYY